MTVPRLPLPLRDELFLLGHDDDNGQPYIDRQALALGLAGAVLIDLFLAGRIVLTSNDDSHPAGEQWLRLRSYQPVGDLIADSAIGYIRHGHANPPVRSSSSASLTTCTSAPERASSPPGSCGRPHADALAASYIPTPTS
ncbi:hypothetical protein GCM10029963_63860 [Micromonospora andamanensis]